MSRLRRRGRAHQLLLEHHIELQRDEPEPEQDQPVLAGLRTQLSSEDAARIYKCAGGAYDRYDQTPCVVSAGAGGDTAADSNDALRAGITMDSGIAERAKALFSSAVDQEVIDNFKRTIWVSYPVPVAPLNPWHGYVLPASCPYKNCPLAIPHLSAGGLDFLMEDCCAGLDAHDEDFEEMVG